MESRILQDKREIKGIYFNDEECSCFTDVTGYKIEAYPEPREFCYVAFFEVSKDGKVVARVPASQVMVSY